MVALTGAWRDGLAAAPAGVITAQSAKPHIPTNVARNRAIFPIENPRTSALRKSPGMRGQKIERQTVPAGHA
jgi:hypothetical protein